MFKSIIITAFRNLVRNRSFSCINLIGLSISMSLALLIITVVKEQYTFDNFHFDSERIFRVNTMAIRKDGGREPYASTPLAIGRVLKDDYSFAEDVVRINRQLNADAIFKNVNVPVHGLFVDPSFLQLFNFPLEKGNTATALLAPNNLVITEKAAEKIFGQQEPIGKTISLSGYGEFQVTGVLKSFKSKTHFDFEILASSSALPLMERENKVMASLDNWSNYYTGYIYFKLKEGRTKDEVEKALAEVAKKQYANLKLETRDRGYEFYLQSLRSITPGPILSNQMGNGMPDLLIIFLSTLVIIIMIMACFNYTNLMIAKSLSRVREIGIRKVVGAQRAQVFIQFVGEAVVFSLFALVASYILMQLIKPAFLQLNIAREFATELSEDVFLYIYFLGFAIFIGIVAGLLPAGYLSAFRPATVLKDSGSMKVYSRLTFRKILIVTQFSLSLVFVIVVLVIYNQINYMVTKDYGIEVENIMNVRLQGMEFQKLANEVRGLQGVLAVGGVSHPMGTFADHADDYKRNRDDGAFVMRDFYVDDNYVNNIELRFIAGRNFDRTQEGKTEKNVILNERALKLFQFTDPVSAIGQTIYAADSLQLTVIGVVKDFNFRPLNYQIGPLALRYQLNQLTFLSARIAPGHQDQLRTQIEAIWKKLDPVHPIELKMMRQEIDDAYTDSGFRDVLIIVGYVSFLAISIACLGMLGMAMYSTQTRFKEIGIRKVMGASRLQVTTLLSRSFLYLIAFATIIGVPTGYWLAEVFLTNYAYKADISPLLIFTGIFVVSLLGMITIGSQTWHTASANPVKFIRYE